MSEFDPRKAEGVLAMIREGLPRRFAATGNAIAPRTLDAWLTEGILPGADPKQAQFARDVYAAEAELVREAMTCLRELAREDARAAKDFLTLRFPKDFAVRVEPGPDEFAAADHSRTARARLLANPPPRMQAELRAAGWVKVEALPAPTVAVDDSKSNPEDER